MRRRIVVVVSLVLLGAVVLGLSLTSKFDGVEATRSDIELGWVEINEPVDLSSLTNLPAIRATNAAQSLDMQKPTLVNVWASFCGPCKDELPWLGDFARNNRVQVVGVTRDFYTKYATRALRRADATFLNYMDSDATFAESLYGALPVDAIPVSFIVEDGTITWAHIGPFDSYSDLSRSVRQKVL